MKEPDRFEVIKEPRGRIIKFYGQLTKALIDECHSKTDSDPDYDMCRYVVVDNQNLSDVQMTELDGKMLGARDRVSADYTINYDLRMAHVVPIHLAPARTQLYKDVHEIYHATCKCGKLKVQFFEDFEPAYAWATENLSSRF